MSSDPNCIFCKIVEGKIPSRKVYEDEDVFGFHDIAPWAPVHFMLVPKKHIASMAQLTPDDAALMGKIMTLAPRLALEQGLQSLPGRRLPGGGQYGDRRGAGGASSPCPCHGRSAPLASRLSR